MTARKTPASFGDNLSELESLEEDLETMLEPEAGWQWASHPTQGKYSTSATGGLVMHRLRIVSKPNEDGSPGEPLVAITIAQRGADARLGRKCRPVAYDRHGQRHVFDGGSGSAYGSTSTGDDWVRATVHRLSPEDLREDDIAFLGIEIEDRPERSAAGS